MGGKHFTKKADPAYPFLNRDRRGKYTERYNMLMNFNLYLQFWFLKCPSDILFGYLTDISIYMFRSSVQFSSFQLLSRVWLFATPWIAARQASLSITNSRSSLRLTSVESVMPSAISSSVVPFSSCPQSLPASESFPVSQLLTWGGQSTGVSALASSLPKKYIYFRHTLYHRMSPGGSDGKESACNAADWGSIPGLGRSPGEGNGNPLQYPCLKNPVDRRAWRATVHGVTQSDTNEWLTLPTLPVS